MKKRYLFPSLVLIGFLALGCSDQKKNSLAPASASAVSAYGDPTGEDAVTWKWIDATHIEKTYYLSRQIHGQRVTIGPIKVVYVCDYPIGFYGPLPAGHCYTDGTGCN